jgi:hypothetical protein
MKALSSEKEEQEELEIKRLQEFNDLGRLLSILG